MDISEADSLYASARLFRLHMQSCIQVYPAWTEQEVTDVSK